jgi:hypothetical protein
MGKVGQRWFCRVLLHVFLKNVPKSVKSWDLCGFLLVLVGIFFAFFKKKKSSRDPGGSPKTQKKKKKTKNGCKWT